MASSACQSHPVRLNHASVAVCSEWVGRVLDAGRCRCHPFPMRVNMTCALYALDTTHGEKKHGCVSVAGACYDRQDFSCSRLLNTWNMPWYGLKSGSIFYVIFKGDFAQPTSYPISVCFSSVLLTEVITSQPFRSCSTFCFVSLPYTNTKTAAYGLPLPMQIHPSEKRNIWLKRVEGSLNTSRVAFWSNVKGWSGQAAKLGFLRRVRGVTLRDKVRSCEILTTLNVEPLHRIKRSQLCWFGNVSRNVSRKICEASPVGYTQGKAT